MSSDKSFFTVAIGQKYLDYAYTLARSYKYHNDLQIPFYILTSKPIQLPKDLSWVKVLIDPKINRSLEYRFDFCRLAPSAEAIFIDSDSIIYANLEGFFEQLNTHSINVVGTKILKGVWADLDAEATSKKFNLEYLIRYCGAFYYIRKAGESSKICDFAKSLNKKNNSFQQHATGVNDEPIMSIAMAFHRVEPVEDTGNMWSDLAQMKEGMRFSVFNRKPRFENLISNCNYKFWLPEGLYSPAILHMGGNIHNRNPWIFDAIRLKLIFMYHVQETPAEFIVSKVVVPVYFGLKYLKNLVKKN